MKALSWLSAVMGTAFGITAYFVLSLLETKDALLMAFICGALFYALLFPVLVIIDRKNKKKYDEFKKTLDCNILHETFANVDMGNQAVAGMKIFICENSLVLVSLEKKPYTTVCLEANDMTRYEFDGLRLRIYTKGENIFVITAPDAQKITNIFEEQGWGNSF